MGQLITCVQWDSQGLVLALHFSNVDQSGRKHSHLQLTRFSNDRKKCSVVNGAKHRSLIQINVFFIKSPNYSNKESNHS